MRNVLSLSLLCLASTATTASADDLLQLVVIASGNESDAALADAAQDSATFLNQFVSAEGSSYSKLAPGASLPVARKLVSSPQDEPYHHRELPDLGCPNACSKSGSSKCQLLGCAYCGTCGGRRDRRRTRSLQLLRTAAQQRKIESDLQEDLDAYCEGKAGCTLQARILRTNADGTATRAN
jgi:hypothetical protein